MAANHTESTVLSTPLGEILQVVRSQAFCSYLNLELKSENPTSTGVWFRFHHGMSFSSYGEKITLTLTPLADGRIRLDCHSECGMPTQVIDWGKNQQNACNILEYITANVRQIPMPAYQQPTYQQPASQPTYQQPAPQPQATNNFKFCYNCGNKLQLDHIFCSRCGARQSR